MTTSQPCIHVTHHGACPACQRAAALRQAGYLVTCTQLAATYAHERTTT